MKAITKPLRHLLIAAGREFFAPRAARRQVEWPEDESGVSVHMVVGHNMLAMGLLALRSWEFHTRRRWPLIIHDDGSFTDQDRKTLFDHFPQVRIVDRAQADEEVAARLEELPACRRHLLDKEGADPQRIRSQLTEYGLVPEEYGGDTMFVEVSARQNLNIDELLEAVLLTADAALDMRANPNKDARGIAIEANLDKGRGAVATVLVQSGTLHVGDTIVAGTAHGRVRAMFDDDGSALTEAGPSRPVQVLGLSNVPRAGDTFFVTADERTARQIAEKREAADRNAALAKRRKRISLEDFDQAVADGKIDTLNLILKGDVSGAVEALEDALLKIDVGEGVQLRVIHRGVGAITQNDVNLATVDSAVIIGFNVKPAERVAELADREGVDMRFYSVIYAAIDDIEAALKGMLKPEYEEHQLGTAEVREVFRSSKFGNIAGSIVRSGVIRRNAKARISRDGKIIGDNLTVETLKRFKDDATEVRTDFECGIGLGSYNDINEGDIIETFEMREKPRV